MKDVAIVQSNYIPWKGYFDLIGVVDEFILLDDVQFTRRDWRNRNRIKTPNGLAWLTVPVRVKGRYHQTIEETEVSDPEWASVHVRTLEMAYSKADHFSSHGPWAADLYAKAANERFLSKINRFFIEEVAGRLGVSTSIRSSSEFAPEGTRSARLISLCRQARADRYVTGPSARSYLDTEAFAAAGIAVCWADYGSYPEYPQLHGPFEHAVSILDLLFNAGPDANRYLGGLRVHEHVPVP